MLLSQVDTQSVRLSRFLLLAPREARASSTCPTHQKEGRQDAHFAARAHVHKLCFSEAAVAVFVEDSPYNIQQVRPQLQHVTNRAKREGDRDFMAEATLGDNCMADRHLNAGNGPHSAHKLVALDPLLAIQSVYLQYERASGCMESRSFATGGAESFEAPRLLC